MAHLKIRCTVDGHVLLPGENCDECPVCGEQQWEYLCEAQGKHFRGERCPWCAYVFQGEEFKDPAALARAFVNDWELALTAIQSNPPSQWVRGVCCDTARADRMSWLDAESHLEPPQRLSLTVALLDYSLPLIWEGIECEEAQIAEDPTLGLAILESQMPRCCRVIGIQEWLPDLEYRYRTALTTLSKCLPDSVARPSPAGILSLVLGNPSALGMTEALPLALVETCMGASELSYSLRRHTKRRRLEFPSPPPSLNIGHTTAPAIPRSRTTGRLPEPDRLPIKSDTPSKASVIEKVTAEPAVPTKPTEKESTPSASLTKTGGRIWHGIIQVIGKLWPFRK